MRKIAFFNNKGGVGKTTLVYHLSWMFALQRKTVLVADLDPQANVTTMFLPDSDQISLFEEARPRDTIFESLRPLLDGTGDIEPCSLRLVTERLFLIPGDLDLSLAEDELSTNWSDCLDGKPRAFRVISALSRVIDRAAQAVNADIALIDLGPNLGSLNRAALIAATEVVVPLAPDLYSLQGLRNLGPRLMTWREEWRTRIGKASPSWNLNLPSGEMRPIGYVVMQHAVRADRPVQAFVRWMDRIPSTYAESVRDTSEDANVKVEQDPNCLGMLKNYRSLMPLAQEARKPMFLLKPSDGALGSHTFAVQACYDDFEQLAARIESTPAPS